MKRYIHLLLSGLLVMGCSDQKNRSDAYGNFEASPTLISAEANGKLVKFTIEEGQVIEAGELIGITDTTALDLQRKKIRATMGTLPKKARSSVAEIEVLINQKQNLIRERDRVSRLLERKAATAKQLDDINGQIEVVDKQIEAIRSNTQTANRAIMAEIDPLVAQMEIINDQIRKAYIYNPVNGTVLTKLKEQHEMVNMGTPLYRIADLSSMTLKFYAEASQIQDVKIGQKVEVLIDKGKQDLETLEGTISWISEEAEFTPKTIQTKEDRVNLVYALKATVPNPGGTIKIGMPGEVNFK